MSFSDPVIVMKVRMRVFYIGCNYSSYPSSFKIGDKDSWGSTAYCLDAKRGCIDWKTLELAGTIFRVGFAYIHIHSIPVKQSTDNILVH